MPNQCVLWKCVLAMALAGVARGAAPSDPTAARAEFEMSRGRFRRAATVLLAATRAHPKDARLWHLLGRAYKGLGQNREALTALRKAAELGTGTPELHQATGDALMGLGRFEEALAEFHKGPPTADNHMRRALALIRLKRPRAALAVLDGALAMAPALEPRIRILRSSALGTMGKTKEAEAEIDAGKLKATDPFSRLMYKAIERSRLRAAPEAARWGYQLTFGTGYSDNVTLLPDEAIGVLEQELANEQDAFIMESASAWFRLSGDQRSGLIARGSVTAIQHEDLHDFDSMIASAGLMGYCTHGPFRFEVGGDLGYTEVDYQTYAHTCTGHLTARWLQSPASRTSLSYYLSHRDFKFTVLPVEDRDGQLHLVRLTQELSLPILDRRIYLAPYAEWGCEDTQGRSSENDFWGVGAYVRCPVVRRVDAFANVGYRDRDYDHPNVRSFTGERRSDHEWRMGAGLQCAVSDHTVVTAEWRRVNQNSNIPESFSFEQDMVIFSVTIFGP